MAAGIAREALSFIALKFIKVIPLDVLLEIPTVQVSLSPSLLNRLITKFLNSALLFNICRNICIKITNKFA